jgi:hypothetical protein
MIQAMNKYLSRHIVVLDLVEFVIVLMDKIHVLGLDMLSECDQDGLSLQVFAATTSRLPVDDILNLISLILSESNSCGRHDVSFAIA